MGRNNLGRFDNVHGMTNSTEHKSYTSAKARCCNPSHMNYKYYGGRGIEFRFTSFLEFYNHIGPKPTLKHSLDRKDTNGHYELGNVQWETQSNQIKTRRGYMLKNRGDKGSFFRKDLNKWLSSITHKGKRIYLGLHATEDAAKEAYQKKLKEIIEEYDKERSGS